MDLFERIHKLIGKPLPDLPPEAERTACGSTKGDAKEGPDDARQGKEQSTSEARRKSARQAERETQKAFRDNWQVIRSSLLQPDQAALHHGITRTDLKARLDQLCDALVYEANRASTEAEVAGPCMETLLEADILGQLVKLTANDKVPGSQAQVVRLFSDLTILLDERFLSRQAVHRPLVRLLRICVGDDSSSSTAAAEASSHGAGDMIDPNEDEESSARRRFGRGGSAEILGFEEDLVNLLCHIASRLRNTPDLLIIFFREKSNDEETRRAFNRAMTGTPSPSTSSSRTSTRPPSPNPLSPNFRGASAPAVSSPLRPADASPALTSPDTSTRNVTPSPADSSASAQAGLPFDFPLFSYLMRFVHRESRTGELARAGLLFLIDVAFAPGRRNITRTARRSALRTTARDAQSAAAGAASAKSVRGRRPSGVAAKPSLGRITFDLGLGPSTALARFIVESDFSEVLGASVGAVYGLLPTKLTLSVKKTSRDGMNLGEGRSSEPVKDVIGREIEANDSDNVRTQARLLCDLVEFTQDILRTASRLTPGMPLDDGEEGSDKTVQTVPLELCSAGQILVASICDHVQALFLESILYPSMLECSDSDGSAVAVMTYIDAVMSVLEDDSPFADCIIGWLVATDMRSNGQQLSVRSSDNSTRQPKKHRSRAMLQLEKESASRVMSPQASYYSDVLGRYTIRDLVLDNMNPSARPMAAVAALRLVNTLMTFHGRFAISNVLRTIPQEHATAFPAVLLYAKGNGEDNDHFDENDDDDDDDDTDDFVYPRASKELVAFNKRQRSLARRIVSSCSAWQYTTEMELYLSLIGDIERCAHTEGTARSDDDSFSRSTGFDNYIEDAESALLQDSMYRLALLVEEQPQFGLNIDKSRKAQAAHDLRQSSVSLGHSIAPTDRLVRTALQSLCSFWKNAPDVNVSLMGLLVSLASCPVRSLEGLFAFSHNQEQAFLDLHETDKLQSADDDEDDRSDDERAYMEDKSSKQMAPRKSAPNAIRAPVVACIFKALLEQLQMQRSKIRRFDRYLAERRRGLLFIEDLDEALRASGVDEKGGISRDDYTPAFGPLQPSPKEARRLWESSNKALQVESSPDVTSIASPTQVSLPEPPSATPSQGMSGERDDVLSTVPSVEGTPSPESHGETIEPEPSTFARLFGRGRHSRTPSLAAAKKRADTQSKSAEATEQPAPKPFAQHYLETSSIMVDVAEVSLARTCPWSPQYDPSLATATKSEVVEDAPMSPGATSSRDATVKRTRFLDVATSGTSDGDGNAAAAIDGNDSFLYPGQDVGNDAQSAGAHPKQRSSTPPVFLSTLLDNVVILEESIKELVAILHVRRALGIDPISFM